jgi:hypothetical protein
MHPTLDKCPSLAGLVVVRERQQPRHALQKARVVIDHDHDCRLLCRLPYPCPAPVRYVPRVLTDP